MLIAFLTVTAALAACGGSGDGQGAGPVIVTAGPNVDDAAGHAGVFHDRGDLAREVCHLPVPTRVEGYPLLMVHALFIGPCTSYSRLNLGRVR